MSENAKLAIVSTVPDAMPGSEHCRNLFFWSCWSNVAMVSRFSDATPFRDPRDTFHASCKVLVLITWVEGWTPSRWIPSGKSHIVGVDSVILPSWRSSILWPSLLTKIPRKISRRLQAKPQASRSCGRYFPTSADSTATAQAAFTQSRGLFLEISFHSKPLMESIRFARDGSWRSSGVIFPPMILKASPYILVICFPDAPISLRNVTAFGCGSAISLFARSSFLDFWDFSDRDAWCSDVKREKILRSVIFSRGLGLWLRYVEISTMVELRWEKMVW